MSGATLERELVDLRVCVDKQMSGPSHPVLVDRHLLDVVVVVKCNLFGNHWEHVGHPTTTAGKYHLQHLTGICDERERGGERGNTCAWGPQRNIS